MPESRRPKRPRVIDWKPIVAATALLGAVAAWVVFDRGRAAEAPAEGSGPTTVPAPAMPAPARSSELAASPALTGDITSVEADEGEDEDDEAEGGAQRPGAPPLVPAVESERERALDPGYKAFQTDRIMGALKERIARVEQKVNDARGRGDEAEATRQSLLAVRLRLRVARLIERSKELRNQAAEPGGAGVSYDDAP